MTTLVPREEYSREELKKLYPEALELHFVQIILRHGERAPVGARFQNAGLTPYWPYCTAASRLTSTIMTNHDRDSWSTIEWRRRLETFGPNDASILAAGPSGTTDSICTFGEITDKGRKTTLALGERLRRLYVDQLKFLPPIISDPDMIYLRASPVPRALESVMQSFWGLYPLSARTATFPPPTFITRNFESENLVLNTTSCKRFAQLSDAFAERCAERWNDSPELKYLTKRLGKWMPGDGRVKVDSKPRLSGIMDTLNSTLAHGPATRLPGEFYEDKVRSIIDHIGVEEWFAGLKENHEYRTLGIGSLAGDIVTRMIGSIERSGNDGLLEVGGKDGKPGTGRGGEKGVLFGMSGAHDTTLGALLCSLGAFDGEGWPPYSSHLAFELFRDETTTGQKPLDEGRLARPATTTRADVQNESQSGTTLLSWLGLSSAKEVASKGIERKPLASYTQSEIQRLSGYFVRVRYNDRIVTVPGCKPTGKHWGDDESFCTLEAFKSIVDKFTPSNWKDECTRNLDQPALKDKEEPAG